MIQAFVDDFDLQADFVDGGSKAVQKASTYNYDLIFMDIQMPGMDGIAAAKEIRKLNQHNSKIPIIALTAHAIKGERERIIRSGMDDFLTKPIAQDELRQNIQQWTRSTVIYKTKNSVSQVVSTNSNENISSIDWELSLKNANRKENLAKQMLNMLTQSFEESEINISHFLKNNELEKLISEVHKIHGATAYCGVPLLKKLACKFESELKLNGISDKAKKINGLFVEEMKSVKNISHKYLS